ncbi:hypothetical protein PQR02_20135 [Paraburkholderia sediminicola]|uniref:Uncharacterized protein n=1 Tax=Paraburkholderia rhynchosiae TaxID=487049 RepID=A0ACC7NPH5_9BURK
MSQSAVVSVHFPLRRMRMLGPLRLPRQTGLKGPTAAIPGAIGLSPAKLRIGLFCCILHASDPCAVVGTFKSKSEETN